jgi:hypothetical protein
VNQEFGNNLAAARREIAREIGDHVEKVGMAAEGAGGNGNDKEQCWKKGEKEIVGDRLGKHAAARENACEDFESPSEKPAKRIHRLGLYLSSVALKARMEGFNLVGTTTIKAASSRPTPKETRLLLQNPNACRPVTCIVEFSSAPKSFTSYRCGLIRLCFTLLDSQCRIRTGTSQDKECLEIRAVRHRALQRRRTEIVEPLLLIKARRSAASTLEAVSFD